MRKNFNINIGRFRDICQEEGILSLLYLKLTSCNTTKIVAKTSFLANITATFARQHWHCICSANIGTAFAGPTLVLHLQRPLWHCIFSRQLWHYIYLHFACKTVDNVTLTSNPQKKDQNITCNRAAALVPIKFLYTAEYSGI